MTADITPENVARMLDGVTPGPWAVSGVRGNLDRQPVHNVFRYNDEKGRDEQIAAVWYDTKTGLGWPDARFIAWAREAVPALAARVAELEVEAYSRDVRIFELREKLDDAEAKLDRMMQEAYNKGWNESLDQND